MGWPDVSRWIWSYVISRLRLFTNLDPSKLELSATSLSVANVEIDKERLPIPGVETTQFTVERLTAELTSTGLAVGASGVRADAVVKSLEPPDLAISRILEHTRSDMEGYGGGDMSNVKSRFADFALSQVRLHVTDISATLRYPSSDTVIRVHVDQVVMNQKHRIEIESVTVTRGFDSDSDSADSCSASSASSAFSERDEGGAAASNGGDEADVDADEAAQNRMAQSVLYGRPGSVFANSSLVKSVYFDALDRHRTPHRDDDELATVNRAILTFSMDPLEFAVDVDKVRVDGLIALQCIVETLNLVWKTAPAPDAARAPANSQLLVASLEIHESLAETSAAPLSFQNIRLQDGKLDIEELDIPEVINIRPLLSAVEDDGRLKVSMPVPVSVALSIDSIPHIHRLATRIGEILSDLETPPDPRPTQVDIKLPEFRLAIGQNFTLLVFPESLSNDGFLLREILLRASEGQLLVRNLECATSEGSASLKFTAEELRARWSAGFVNELRTILRLLAGLDEGAAAPVRTWRALELPSAYCKVGSLVLEDEETAAALMQGDLEFRTVGANADLRANLEVYHPRFKTVFEVSAYSTDGLSTVESTMSVFDCDVFLDEDVAVSEAPKIIMQSSPEFARSSIAPHGHAILPQVRTKLDFGNGIRVHFPDEHKSVFMISLEECEVITRSDGAASLNLPGLYVKLEDPGGDVSLLKMQEAAISHFFTAGSGFETTVNVKSVLLATCPDTYCLLTKLPILVIPPPLQRQFDVDPDTSVDIFKDISETRFSSEQLRNGSEDDLAITLDSIDIKEDYMLNRSTAKGPSDAGTTTGSVTTAASTFKFTMRTFQWQMFDGFDLQRTRKAISEAIQRIESAVSDATESDHDTDDDEDDRIVVGDFMYNSVLVVAKGGTGNGHGLSKQVASELGGTGSQGYDRSSEPKLRLVLKKSEIEQKFFPDARSHHLSITIRDGKVSDNVSTSAFSYMLSPIGATKENIFMFTQDTLQCDVSPELRVAVSVQPLRLQLDQDTVEFLNRFFQFDIDDKVVAEALAKRDEVSSASFLQRFELAELPLVIDYTPKKIDYKSLRSGVAAELVNLFVVKGAKLTLKPSVLHGVNGWDRLGQELAGLWAPDIKANQLTGLLSGISPVRKALRLSKGLKSWAIVPMRSKRTGQVTRGAGLVVRRTVDELLRLRTAWLDSTDKALGGDTDPDSVLTKDNTPSDTSGASERDSTSVDAEPRPVVSEEGQQDEGESSEA